MDKNAQVNVIETAKFDPCFLRLHFFPTSKFAHSNERVSSKNGPPFNAHCVYRMQACMRTAFDPCFSCFPAFSLPISMYSYRPAGVDRKVPEIAGKTAQKAGQNGVHCAKIDDVSTFCFLCFFSK